MFRASLRRLWKTLRGVPLSLAIAFTASAVLFAPTTDTRTSEQTAGPTDAQDNPAAARGEGQSADLPDGQMNLPTNEDAAPSLLAQLFGAGAIDPLFKLPDAGLDYRNANPDSVPSPDIPTTEPARSIYWYLVNSSNVGFEPNTSRLNLALATAESGNGGALDALIRDYEDKLDAFQNIPPPEELRQLHEDSSRVLLRYVQHLKNVGVAEPGKVRETWTGPELSAIGAEAARLTQQIRDIVRTNNITLPTGVLP